MVWSYNSYALQSATFNLVSYTIQSLLALNLVRFVSSSSTDSIQDKNQKIRQSKQSFKSKYTDQNGDSKKKNLL